MFNPITSLFRTIWYKVLSVFGVVDKKLRVDPGVVGQKYDNYIQKLRNDIDNYMNAVSSMMSLHEKKKRDFDDTQKRIEKLTQKKAGAFKLAQKLSAELVGKGKNPDEIKQDPEIIKYMGYYRDFSSSLQSEIERVESLQEELQSSSKNIKSYQLKLLEMKRKIDEIREQKEKAVADVITAKQEMNLNKLVAGLSTDASQREIEDIGKDIADLKNKAKLTSIVAGTEGMLDEVAMEEAGRSSEAEKEFMDMLLGPQDKTKKAAIKDAKSAEKAKRLPE
jgi:flagellar biosynthesis chaperone FliJ